MDGGRAGPLQLAWRCIQSTPSMRPEVSERRLLFLVAAVQFINILDFMMVMPLGPDFATALHIPNARLGLIGGSYTAAAAAAGLLGSLFLDRFDRRSALGLTMLGLVLGTFAGGLARGMSTLMAARVLAGAFGGPATSLSLSIIADVVPAERRGKAMGAVMGAFSAASVLGVPAGLELARHGGWRAPFFAVAALGLPVAAGAILLMPPLRGHLTVAADPRASEASLLAFVRRPIVALALASTVTVMFAIFMIIPNLSAYFQFNVGYPRARLSLLYLIGGVVSFAVMRVVGQLVDRFGAPAISAVGTLTFITTLMVMLYGLPTLPVMAVFVSFMIGGSFRGVAFNTLSSRVPLPAERARFMSLQSAVQHLSSAAGAFAAAQLLRERADHSLAGMGRVAAISISVAALLPGLMWLVGRRVHRRDRELAAAAARLA
jgi:predicted MFS family arabinose efflux permease